MPSCDSYIDVTVIFTQDEDGWTAECVELGTCAFGDTLDEALAAIADLIQLHVKALKDIGQRKAFFRKHGITCHRGDPEKARRREVSAKVAPGCAVARLTECVPPVPASG